MYTIDTNVIIDYLKGDEKVALFFDRVSAARIPVFVSAITETEALGYPRLTEADIQAIENVFLFCNVIHTNSNLTRRAAEICRRCRVKPLDGIIAATAIFTNSTLATRDEDFKRIPELVIEAI